MTDSAWYHATVVERCDSLKKIVVELVARVAELEKGQPVFKPATILGNYGRVLVSEAEFARLRRIEEAARALDEGWERVSLIALDDWAGERPRRYALRAALESEPKR